MTDNLLPILYLDLDRTEARDDLAVSSRTR
jgi:hypothetical protein